MSNEKSEKNKEEVLIRPIRESDRAAVAKMWREGLSQTTESLFFPLRWYVARHMEKYGDEAMSEGGDVGPAGQNLVTNWLKDDRTMLVACLPEAPDRSVGAVGVKVGMDYKEREIESKVASIWRMTVDESVRRRGVGKALMLGAEQWARERGCTSMGLWTANPAAQEFYQKKMGYQEEVRPKKWWEFRHYLVHIGKYYKSLVVAEGSGEAPRKN